MVKRYQYMKKFLLFTLLLAFTNIHSLHAVQIGSQEEDKKALRRGKKTETVCYISFSFGKDDKGKPIYIGAGTGSLVESDVVLTAGHVIYDGIDDLLHSRSKNVEKQTKNFFKKLKKGKPIHLSGFVTFTPNVHQSLIKNANPKQDNLSQEFYEIDSVIMHPDYCYKDGDAETDLAFVKLKNPVLTLQPLSLYKKGVIPSLEFHEIDNLDMKGLIKGHFSGYGSDTSGRFGKRRTVSQFCFLENDSDSEEEGCLCCCGGPKNKHTLALTDYMPSLQGETDIQIDDHAFHDALVKQKKEGEVYGLLYRGDSGGPFIVEDASGQQYIAAIESTQGGSGPQQSQVESFQDVQKIGRAYYSYLCPLFNVKGELRPELPKMLGKLKQYPIKFGSNLHELLLEAKFILDLSENYISSIETLNSAICDMDYLLGFRFQTSEKKKCQDNEKLVIKAINKIEKKYNKEKINDNNSLFTINITFDFSDAKTLLEKNKFEEFNAKIKEKKEKILNLKAQFIKDIGIRE